MTRLGATDGQKVIRLHMFVVQAMHFMMNDSLDMYEARFYCFRLNQAR